MSDKPNQHLDVDFETARAIHRIVRAMHDGECPKCHRIMDSRLMRNTFIRDGSKFDLVCPECGFCITEAEQAAAMQTFAPVMERNLALFELWVSELRHKAGITEVDELHERAAADRG